MSGASPRTTNTAQVAEFVTSHNDTYPLISPTSANLAGKSMLITGASKGVGRTTAIRFAMAGCSEIAIAARSPLSEVEEAVKAAAAGAGHPEPHVLALNVDVTAEASVKAAAVAVEEAFGGSLDILIANAGYMEPWEPIAETDPALWWKSWETNIKGTYLCTRFFIPLLMKSSLKTLVTVSSIGAQIIAPGASAYSSNKFAMCRFTEFADQEYHDAGLIAIAVHPGGIKTELSLNMPAYIQPHLIDTLELAGDAMVWLARERREWLAGRYFMCTWDVKELEDWRDEIVSDDLLKFRLKV